MIGKEHINIQSDIINNDIPLLFSRTSMKKAQMKINFQDDTIHVFGENIPLVKPASGHYALPLTQAKQAINNINRDSSSNITLTITENTSNKAMALNFHRQFAHPTHDKPIGPKATN